jgi:ribosome biogenesis GTPase / thiamine phosphate phosphatase
VSIVAYNAAMAKKKLRVDFRRNLAKPPRQNDLTETFKHEGTAIDAASAERVRAKGAFSRKRTVVQDGDGAAVREGCLRGRVLRIMGLHNHVEFDDGRVVPCSISRVLKSLATEERSPVTTGDVVWVRPVGQEGMIESVEARRGVLTRASRRREHVLVANVDQVCIVVSLVQPELKPHLIDRYLATACRGELKPIICLNKADLTDPAEWQPLVGAYSQLGIPCLLTSPISGKGISRLQELLKDQSTVFSGQSGVGKSSLLNAVEPGLGRIVREVSDVNQKGQHTTTTAELIKLSGGGWVVDTPGVRQLQLFDARPEEAEGYFPEFAPFVASCKYPDCTHTHEGGCAVLDAVRRGWLAERRYVSYLGLRAGDDG